MMGISQPILVTGAAGFIGANLVHHLIKKLPVHIIVRRSSDLWRLKPILDKLTIHYGDLLDKKSLQTIISQVQPKTIYHCASYGNYSFHENVDQMIQVNILGSRNLIESCRIYGFDCFVNTGTSSEYGFKSKPMKETDSLEPMSFYAATKSTATLFNHVYAHSSSLPIVTLRLFSVYGPYEEQTRFVPTIARNLIEKKPIRITQTVARRDFIYVDDVVRAYVWCSKNINSVRGHIFNIGTGQEHNNQEVVKIFSRVMRKKAFIEKINFPNRQWDTPHWVANISKAKKYGWIPRHTLEQGLRKTGSWYVKWGKHNDKKS